MMIEERQKMVRVFGDDKLSFSNGMRSLRRENADSQLDLSTILLEVCAEHPEVFKVNKDIFKNKRPIRVSAKTSQNFKEIMATLEVQSSPELMEAIKRSRLDKGEGRTRKYEDLARECGLL